VLNLKKKVPEKTEKKKKKNNPFENDVNRTDWGLPGKRHDAEK